MMGEFLPSSLILLEGDDDPPPPAAAVVAADDDVVVDLSDKASSKIRLAGPSMVRSAFSIN